MLGFVVPLTRILRRFRRPTPEESRTARAATLIAVLLAVVAVGIQEDFTAQAEAAAAAIIVGHVVSYLRRRHRNWWLKAIIAALILVVARDFFATLVANPYDPRVPLVRLFLWLQVLHSFDLPAPRDLKYSLASAMILMAVGAVYARAAAFGLFMIPFAAAAGTALVALQIRQGRLPLWSLVSLGTRLSGAVLVCASLVFVLVPRSEGLRIRWTPVSARLLWAGRLHTRILNPAYPDLVGQDPEQSPAVFNPQSYVGFSTYVDLRLRGVLDDALVLRVRATRPGYWRGLAFDTYTGRGWRMRERAVEEYATDQPGIVPNLGPDEPWPAGSEQSLQTFYIEANQPNVIFAAYRPFEIFFPTGAIAVDRYAGLRSPLQLEGGMVYSVISRVPGPTTALLVRSHGAVPAPIRARYLQLPRLPPRVRDLALTITADAGSPYQKAMAIRRYLQHGFTYTLQAPLLPAGSDAVDEFLFASRQGSCEAFASAMAVLLRAAGVPARLVTGYTTGSYNLLTSYYEVHNSDAHAWVEVFQPGAGWLEVEASPGFASTGNLGSEPTSQWLARDMMSWVAGVVGHTVHALPLAPVGRAVPGVLALGTITILSRLLTHLRTRRDRRRSRPVVEACYENMLRVLARRGLISRPAYTPREFAATLPATVRPAAERLTTLFEAFRYGHRSGQGAEVSSREAFSDVQEALRRAPRQPVRVTPP